MVVDLGGKTVLPGFNDTHSHMTTMGINLPTMIDLTEITSIDDIKTGGCRTRESDGKGRMDFQ